MKRPQIGIIRSVGSTLAALIVGAAPSQPAAAADQVLACIAESGSGGGDAQVLISERMFGQGRILWPSQAGTTVFLIQEKTAVSYVAAEDAAKTKHPSRLYLNRLNGALHFEFAPDGHIVELMKKVCSGTLAREQCSRQMAPGDAGLRSLCFASIDCGKLAKSDGTTLYATYKCRRSFKKL